MNEPVIGFLYFGGPLSGALIRDIRLANELAERGYNVHVWWMMDQAERSGLHPRIRQYFLFHGFRFVPIRVGVRLPRAFGEGLGRFMTWWWSEKKRHRSLQKRPDLLDKMMSGFMEHVCDGVEKDRGIVDRFARQLQEAGVTHMLPMLSVLCPWVMAARRRLKLNLKYLVTFQGYELYLHYARRVGRDAELTARLREAVEQSDWPCIAVSEDYARRVNEDIGLPLESIHAIPPGVPVTPMCRKEEAAALVRRTLKGYDPGLPLVTYLGRCDNEKGVDLLLYAVNMLRRDGVKLQLAICGPTLFGNQYAAVCRRIAENLTCPVLWHDHVPDEVRSALFFESRCVVYPSIHREPFGMVPVEAQAHGTPAIVPDIGGVAGTIQADGKRGGLLFHAWDSGDLATQIRTLIENDALHRELSRNGPAVADYFSVARLGDRVLQNIGLFERSSDKAELASAQAEQAARFESRALARAEAES